MALVNFVRGAGSAARDAADQRPLLAADQRADAGACRAGSADHEGRFFPRPVRCASDSRSRGADTHDAVRAGTVVEADGLEHRTPMGAAVHDSGLGGDAGEKYRRRQHASEQDFLAHTSRCFKWSASRTSAIA